MATTRARFVALACIAGYAQMHNAMGKANDNAAIDALAARSMADAGAAFAVARIPLRYATAGDRRIDDGSRPVVIEGVASMLRKRLLAEREVGSRVDGGYGQYSLGEPSVPVVEADERTNAIVIRDAANRLAADAELVRTIDVKRRTLQIDVHAVDIDRPAFARIAHDWAGDIAGAMAGPADTHWHTAIVQDSGNEVLNRLANEDNARPVIERALSTISGSTTSIERSRYEIGSFDQSANDGQGVQTWRLTIRPIVVDEQGVSHITLSVVGGAYERAQASLRDGQAMVLWFGLDPNDPALSRIRVFVLAPRDAATHFRGDHG